MKIGLIDVDGHNYPNLALMKISAWHKAQGDEVGWWWGFDEYDRVYMSKVFDATYTPEPDYPTNTKEIVRGGTGWGLDNKLPEEMEHICPDYSLYPELTKDTAYGFLSRGCPRGCPFCIVSGKEGKKSVKVADLGEWWSGQRKIVLMDPNLLACPDREDLIDQLARSGAAVDINQGLDARLMTRDMAEKIATIKIDTAHFAWDSVKDEDAVMRGLETWRKFGRRGRISYGTVYVLVNYDSTIQEDLYRIDRIDKAGYDPFVMVYDKPNASCEIRRMQRWCNNKRVFKACKDFAHYKKEDEL